MTKSSNSEDVYYAATPRCVHCQGRRDERAMVFRKMRLVRQKTGKLLRNVGRLEAAYTENDEPPGDRFIPEPGMVEHVRLLNSLVTTVIKIVQEEPIEHHEQGDCSTMIPLTSSRHTTIH